MLLYLVLVKYIRIFHVSFREQWCPIHIRQHVGDKISGRSKVASINTHELHLSKYTTLFHISVTTEVKNNL